MKTIKYLILKLKTIALSDSPIFFPWWFLILYCSLWSYTMIISIIVIIDTYRF